MKESDVDELFDRLEKHLESVAKQIDVLARATEREFRDLHHSITHSLRARQCATRNDGSTDRSFFNAARMPRSHTAVISRLSNLERSVLENPAPAGFFPLNQCIYTGQFIN